VKWQEERRFDAHDLGRLVVHRSRLPGADEYTPLVIVSRSESIIEGPLALGPDDLVSAYR
jgi:hypothetical protein